MSIDEEFYRFQTNIRNAISTDKLVNLCASEADRIAPLIMEVIKDTKMNHQHRILDAPCGYGNLLYLYSRFDLNATGIDLDEKQIALARSLGLDAVHGDIMRLDNDNKYDVISSFDFLEHISKDSALEVLHRFFSLLNDEGVLIIRTPCGDSPFGLRDFADDPTHKWIGTSVCFKSLLKIAGYENITVKEDWPRYRNFNSLRKLIGTLVRFLIRALLFSSGLSNGKNLSSSMIIIARKPANSFEQSESR
jgi:SAM-dependent methyltransferase